MINTFFTSISIRVVIVLISIMAVPGLVLNAAAQGDPGPADIDRIIRTFTVKETQFRNALNLYSFKRDALIQTLGMGGQVTGEYHRVSHFTFDDQGQRYEKISFFPMPSFGGVTQEDLEDLGG